MPRVSRRFRFRPLTPIHIGTGEKLSVEDYAIDETARELVRLDVPRLLQHLAPKERGEFEEAIDQGRLRDAQQMLQRPWKAARADRQTAYERYRTKLGPSSFDELRQILNQPGRSGEVMVMARNELSGDLTLPGSSIKGALRTAVVSFHANPDGKPLPELTQYRRGSVLEQHVLKYSAQTLENDPFRHVHVSDAVWPSPHVRIDMPRLRKLGHEEGHTKGIQSHAERLMSAADRVAQSTVIDISIDEPDRRRKGGLPLNWDQVWGAAQSFYIGRLNAESDQFPFLRESANGWRPSQKDLERAMLIRVGRFCHFDSMSIDNLRQKPGKVSQSRTQMIGATRTMCEIEPNVQVPFGWALLELA